MKKGDDIMVLGLGNEVLGDEGLGLKIVEDLKYSFSFPNLNYVKATRGGLEIIDYIKDYNEVVIVDTIATSKGQPGDIYYFTPENYRETLHLSSSHDVNFQTAIKTGEALGFNMPGKIDIIAIEIIHDLELGQQFSNNILEKYDEIMLEVMNFIRKKDVI